MDKLVLLLPMLTCFLAVSGSYAVFPYISRRTLSFGISIPESAYAHAKVAVIRNKYRNWVILSGIPLVIAVLLVMSLLPADSAVPAIISTILIFANLGVNGFIYLHAHNQMKNLKTEQGWNENTPQLITVDMNFRKRRIVLSPLWFALYIFVTGATAAISLLLYDALPDMIPMRFNAAGEVIAWSPKSYKMLLYVPVVQLFLTTVFMFAYYMIGKAKQQIDPANREKTLEQNITFRRRWSVFTVVSGLLLLLMCSLIQFSIIGIIPLPYVTTVSVAVPIIIITAVAFMGIKYGQSGNRIKVNSSGQNRPIVREDDSHWKFGVLYYNPDDPSLFIEKRFGIGWTVNWGKPLSWVIFFGLLALIIGFTAFSFKLAG